MLQKQILPTISIFQNIFQMSIMSKEMALSCPPL